MSNIQNRSLLSKIQNRSLLSKIQNWSLLSNIQNRSLVSKIQSQAIYVQNPKSGTRVQNLKFKSTSVQISAIHVQNPKPVTSIQNWPLYLLWFEYQYPRAVSKNTVTRGIPVIFGTSLQPFCILLWLAVDNNLYKVREVVCCVDGVYSSMPVNSELVFFRFYFKVRWQGVSLPWIRPWWAGSSSARSDDWLQTYHRYKFFSELVLLPATTRKRRDYSWDK